MKSTLIQIQCSVPSKKVGKLIARTLVEEHLVACVNILPKVVSFYIYDDQFCEDEELLLLIKTDQSQYTAVEKRIIQLHPYEIPEIIAIKVDKASKPYQKWAAQAIK